MNQKKYLIYPFILSLIILFQSCREKEKRILVFSKTVGFRHESIRDGKIALQKLGTLKGIKVDTTENADWFIEDSLKNYSAIIFLSTTGDILNFPQQVAFERYIQAGGGFLGIHSASDTEYDWPWFVKLVGGNFDSHPQPQKATIRVLDKNHPATTDLPSEWERTDEWYNFKNLNPEVKILAKLDEKTYSGGKNGDNHPLIWYHEYDGGRVFYTELGHTKESYSEELFLKHIAGAIDYAIGNNNKLDYKKATTQALPDESRFTKEILIDDLDEPLMLDIAEDGRVFFIQRKGNLFYYDPKNGSNKKLCRLPVEETAGNGLMGLVLDPDFLYNNYIYLFYINTEMKYTLSRFTITNDNFNFDSEKVILTIPYDKEPGAHNGGTLAFDTEKNLLISIGDNTPPWQANGYAPMDQAKGREIFDAQRTAANSNDLRGKILRIKINSDGSYSIPKGNLFDSDGSEGRPEIYVMGCRNPWRMSIDPKTNYTYWGEVGPDAGLDSTIGSMGYDEINQARKAGNFGWPYCVADNKPYKKINHGTGEIIEVLDPNNLFNTSQNNTGNKRLPQPQKPLIWYPYSFSKEYPELGRGGRTACAGPFYYSNTYKNSQIKFPAYYNGKFFIYDWVRDWIQAVTLDKKGNYVRTEPFATHLKHEHPSHMKFGPDGSLYMIEYGLVWYAQNKNARLSRIVYNSGNRPPQINATISDTAGQNPFKVTFDAGNTTDPDKNDLSFEWDFMGEKLNGKKIEYTFTQPGVYKPTLTVKDSKGLKSVRNIKIISGNTYPEVKFKLSTNNKSFYWSDLAIDYQVFVSDKEDRFINKKDIKVVLDYLPDGEDIYPILQTGHSVSQPVEKVITDNPLIAKSDCKACHTMSKKSVGPAFTAIAEKYKGAKEINDKLARKIISGGSGVWGEHAMSAHPQLSMVQAKEMVEYIFSTISSQGRVTQVLNSNGSIKPKPNSASSKYFITATYVDNGFDGNDGLTGMDFIKLRNPEINTKEKDGSAGTNTYNNSLTPGKYEYIGFVKRLGYIFFNNIDMSSIGAISMQVNSNKASGRIEIRLDSLTGKLISLYQVHPTGKWEDWYEVKSQLEKTTGTHTIYVAYINSNNSNEEYLKSEEMINIKSLLFEHQNNQIYGITN